MMCKLRSKGRGGVSLGKAGVGRGFHVPGTEKIQEWLRYRVERGRRAMRLGQEPVAGPNHLSEGKFLDPWVGLSGLF